MAGMKTINTFSMEKIILSKEDLISIEGGAPTKSTDAAYDIAWGITWCVRELWDAAVATFVDGCKS
jgi:hypothetical protein